MGDGAKDADDYLQTTVTIDIPTGPQCYCSRPRDFSIADFQCSVCYKWFHLDCIAFNIGKSLPFLTAYHFMCKKCNTNGEEVFSRKQANFAVMCQTALANLMWRNGGRLYFSKERELIPFLEEFWEELTTQPRKSNTSWYPNIHKTLTSSDSFKTIVSGTDVLVCLANTDLSKMGPSYDRFRALTSQLRTSITKLGASNTNISASQLAADAGESTTMGSEQDATPEVTGWRKRKSPGSGFAAASQHGSSSSTSGYGVGGLSGYTGENSTADHSSDYPLRTGFGRPDAPSSNAFGGSLVRSTRRGAAAAGSCGTTAVSGIGLSGLDEGRAKLNALGFPIDHPFNKEGYRYILVEPDRHASGRDLWDECEHTAGKPIPGLFYRVYLSPQVVLSVNDRANHLKLHDSQLAITGDKGYCMARATHGVHSGTWYFEATITDQPEGSATRIGWSQLLGNLQAPCGYDKFSYSWRSRLGTVFHDSRGRHYAEAGYKKGDVIGCMIHLPTSTAALMPLDNINPDSKAIKQADSSRAPVKTRHSDVNSTRSMTSILPESYKDRPLIKFRNSYYFEEKDEPNKVDKLLRSHPGSIITFYRNGECLGPAFVDIYAGTYYPAISIYRSATVSINFGPTFRYAPPGQSTEWRPMSERLVGTAIEQTLADMLYLIEKRGLVENVIKSYSAGA